jgi:hypothetical protein
MENMNSLTDKQKVVALELIINEYQKLLIQTEAELNSIDNHNVQQVLLNIIGTNTNLEAAAFNIKYKDTKSINKEIKMANSKRVTTKKETLKGLFNQKVQIFESLLQVIKVIEQ